MLLDEVYGRFPEFVLIYFVSSGLLLEADLHFANKTVSVLKFQETKRHEVLFEDFIK